MCDTDGRWCLVDMLTAGTTASISINTDLIVIDLYIQILLDIRHNITGYKRCLSLTCCIERRNTHQTVNSLLWFQITVSICSVYLESNRFDTCLIAVQIIQHFQGKSFLICPAAVHTVKHTAPVTGLCSACTCIQLNDSILTVIFSGEKCLDTDIVKILLKLIQHFLNLRNQCRIVLLISHLDHGFHIFHLCNQILIGLHVIFHVF